MAILPPVDIFDHVDTRPVNERFSNYINKSTRAVRAKTRDIETARNIKGNLTYLENRTDEELKARTRMEYNPGFDDEVWGKLTVCEKMLDKYDQFKIAPVRSLFKELRSEIINRKMDEFTYGYLNESSVEIIVNDHLPMMDYVPKNHTFAKLFTEALILAEKAYRGFKK